MSDTPTTPPLDPDDPLAGKLTCTVQFAAFVLGVNPNTIWTKIAEDELEATKLGRRTLVLVRSIRWALAEGRVKPHPRTRKLVRHTQPKAAP